MAWTPTRFADVYVFTPRIWLDERGYFIESYNQSTLPDSMSNINFIQDNESRSTRGVLRGLHFQKAPHAQSKLVRCVLGEVLDVIVDVRPESSTFGQHLSLILNDINKKQLFVPQGFAHGYIVLSPIAIFAYKCDNYYHPNSENGLAHDDITLAIDWILPAKERLISAKDATLPTLQSRDQY